MKQKGFTLIELLAVIVILGVLLGIAMPSVSNYITASRKKTFIESAKTFIDTAKAFASDNGGVRYPHNEGDSAYIQLSELSLEKETKESPFGAAYVAEKCYIRIVSVPRGYDFYITLVDTKGNTLNDVKEQDLTVDKISDAADEVPTYETVVASGTAETLEDANASMCSNTVSNNYVAVYGGDINPDGKFDDSDLLQMRRYLLGYDVLTAAGKIAADINCDGKIDDSDLDLLRSIILKTQTPTINRIPLETSGVNEFILVNSELNTQGLYKEIS